MNENDTNSKINDISSKFDLLAKQVLKTSGILPLLPKHWFDTSAPRRCSHHNTNCDDGDDQAWDVIMCHVDALERVLDIPQKKWNDTQSQNNENNALVGRNNQESDNVNVNSCAAKLLTCTDFKTTHLFQSYNNAMDDNNNRDSDPPQYWTPPITDYHDDDNDNNGNSTMHDQRHHQLDDNYNIHIPSLEEMAPFSKQFYISVAQLIAFIYSQSNTVTTTKSNNYMSNHIKIQNYSLPFDVHTVRVTRILSTLMDINVMGNVHEHKHDDDNNNNDDLINNIIQKRKYEEDYNISFMDIFLYYIEQNSILFQHLHHYNDNIINNNHYDPQHQQVPSNNNINKCTNSTSIHIPFLQSLFKYYSNLPQLESHIYTIIRIHRSYNVNNTSTFTRTDHNNMDAKVEHMKMTQVLQDRLEKELEGHLSSLEYIIGTIYAQCDVVLRKKLRLRIGNILHMFVLRCSSSSSPSLGSGSGGGGGLMFGMGVENTSATGIDSMLKILYRILQGIKLKKSRPSTSGFTGDNGNKVEINDDSQVQLQESHLQVLFDILLPLHKPSGMVLWRDQKPILGLYHKALVQCIGSIVSLDTSLIGKVIQYLLHPDVWPLEGGDGNKGSKMANTPKVVLLLHEIDTLIGLLRGHVDNDSPGKKGEPSANVDTLSDAMVPLVLRLSCCISSDNSRTSERALEFFKNRKFKRLVELHIQTLMTPLMRALCRIDSGMEIPWNPTVRKMTLLVLQELESFDEAQFNKSCLEVMSKTRISGFKVINESLTGSAQTQSLNQAPTADMMSLRKSMGSWKPPAKHNINNSTSMPPPKSIKSMSKGTSSAPPLTVTGVAPWSVMGNASRSSSKSQPPLTVTGVAPWSIPQLSKNGVDSMKTRLHKSPLPPGSLHQTIESSSSNPTEDAIIKETADGIMTNAVAKITSFMDQLKKSGSDGEEDTDTDGISNWAKSQMAESPLLLPSLKFHDLVFGQVLGTGSFSTVKYARQIMKGKTRSYWPEFAVKVNIETFLLIDSLVETRIKTITFLFIEGC